MSEEMQTMWEIKSDKNFGDGPDDPFLNRAMSGGGWSMDMGYGCNRARRNPYSKPKTSKASKAQKRQKKARRLNRHK